MPTGLIPQLQESTTDKKWGENSLSRSGELSRRRTDCLLCVIDIYERSGGLRIDLYSLQCRAEPRADTPITGCCCLSLPATTTKHNMHSRSM